MKNANDLSDKLRDRLTKLPAWVDHKTLGLVLIMVIMLVAMAWSEPLPGSERGAGKLALMQLSATPRVERTTAPTVPPDATATPPSATPIPEEWANNREMGTGIVMGAVVLVLIIVLGTLGAIRRR